MPEPSQPPPDGSPTAPRPAPTPAPVSPALSRDASLLGFTARQDLAQQLGMAADAITVVSVEAVDWPDASLGCPSEGMMYAQVITPGYRVVLETDGKTYEYHTGDNQVVLCQ